MHFLTSSDLSVFQISHLGLKVYNFELSSSSSGNSLNLEHAHMYTAKVAAHHRSQINQWTQPEIDFEKTASLL